jgi:hypothetical protein
MNSVNSNSTLDLCKVNARAIIARSQDRAGHRAHFGINLISKAGLPVRLLSPNSKEKFSVSSVIVDAIQIVTCPSTECHEDGVCWPKIDEASVSTTDTTPVEKKVRFNLLQTKEFEPNPLYLLDEKAIAALWYSDAERKSMKFNRDDALCFASDNQDWRDEMDALIQFCTQAIPELTYHSDDLKEKAKSVLPEYRGLEVHGLPKLSAMRQKHMNNVLVYSARIPKKMPEDLRGRMVAARSLQYSRPFTIIALILAKADEAEAQLHP